MRVAMVSEHANPLAAVGGADAGGQNVHVAALSTAMARLGAEIIVYTRRDSPHSPRRAILSEGVTVEHVDAGPPRAIPKDDLLPYMPDLAAGLRRSWLRARPDVVHAHFWMSGLASTEAAWPLDIPVVQTFHALGTVKKRHQGTKDTSPPERLGIEANLARQVDWIVATCTDEVAELTAMGADSRRVSVVPCGVDTDLFSPTGPRCPGGSWPYRIAVVGRLVERKGIEDVIMALRDIPGAELIVAGGPPAADLGGDADACRLAAAAGAAGVADRVRLVGRVDHAELPALLRCSDVVVCAPWYEPFGIVPLEAMACAVPVVATRVGGLVDSVVDGLTGCLVEPRQPLAMAAALRSLLENPDRRLAMGRAGRQRAVQMYTWPDVARATLEAYRCSVRAADLVAR